MSDDDVFGIYEISNIYQPTLRGTADIELTLEMRSNGEINVFVHHATTSWIDHVYTIHKIDNFTLTLPEIQSQLRVLRQLL